MSKQRMLRISGYFQSRNKDSKTVIKFTEERIRVDPSYLLEVRRFDPYDLEVTKVKKFQGAYFNPKPVRLIVELVTGLRFYIPEEKVSELELILSVSRDTDLTLF